MKLRRATTKSIKVYEKFRARKIYERIVVGSLEEYGSRPGSQCNPL